MDDVVHYWWAAGDRGWAIETWRGDPEAENVVVVGYAASLSDAEAIMAELNRLTESAPS